jgi:hopanoid biosynthesis associated RND transporter like protein HpnN
LLTVGAVRISYTDLSYHTQRNDLLSADKPCQQRWQKFLDAFGDDDDMVVVAEGTDHACMKSALDAVAEKVKQRPDLFDRVFYKVDLRHIANRAILHLSPEQLKAITLRLDQMDPLLGVAGPFAWRMLSTQSLLANAALALENRAAGRQLSAADRDLLAQLPAIATSATATLHELENYRNPWSLTVSHNSAENLQAAKSGQPACEMQNSNYLTEPQYFFTPDGTLALFTCRPRKETDSFTPAKEANTAMRAILAEIGPQYPGISLGLTGLPVLETDEMDLSDDDSTQSSWMALLGVAVMYFVVYRGFRYPLFTIATLVVGTFLSLGWATLTIGHLNILTATFAVMLIGLGDYAVLWIAQYEEARQAGKGFDDSLRYAAMHAGPSILTAAATTGLAFFAIMLADFKAVAELGWITGWGVLLCAGTAVVMMPAFLAIIERRAMRLAKKGTPAPPARCGLAESVHTTGAWVPGLAKRPQLALVIGGVLVVACGIYACRVSYDHNLLDLQPRGLDSVVWEHKLIDRAAGATWDAMSIAKSREEALELKAKYEALPEVSRVVEVASLVPADQEQKLPLVQSIHDRLAELPPPDKIPLPAGSDPAETRELALKVAQLATRDTALSCAVTDLAFAIDTAPYVANRLRFFDQHMAADLAGELQQLKSVSHPAPITFDDVPVELRERYRGKNGEYLVRAFAKESLWDYVALKRFTTAANSVDPESTGKAFRTLEGLRAMKVGFEWASLYALIAIVFVMWIDTRRVKDLLLGLFPLVIGMVLTFGVMGLCGVSLNPANMIALPLIVGVGVDNGVHILHDYRHRPMNVAYRLSAPTGRGVLVAALTTVLGFGTLLGAQHEGMASLGLTLTLGVTFCMVAALVWLPAVLRVRDLRRVQREAKNEEKQEERQEEQEEATKIENETVEMPVSVTVPEVQLPTAKAA